MNDVSNSGQTTIPGNGSWQGCSGRRKTTAAPPDHWCYQRGRHAKALADGVFALTDIAALEAAMVELLNEREARAIPALLGR
jgi:uncharacterized protein (DUF2237 family)